MIWIGIGLIIIGLALIALTGILIKPLNKVAAILNDVKETTKDLPETVKDISNQANAALHTGVDTLQQLNGQLKELTPIFYLIGDVGRATHELSSKMVNAVEDFEQKETGTFATRRNLESLYGAGTLGMMIFQKAREFSNERSVIDNE